MFSLKHDFIMRIRFLILILCMVLLVFPVYGGFIGETEPEWVYNFVQIDELMLDFFFPDFNTVEVYPYVWNDSFNCSPSYKWKFKVNYGNTSHTHSEQVNNLKCGNLEQWWTFNLEIQNVSWWNLSAGETSTIVDASSGSSALRDTNAKHLCRDARGMLHIGYEGSGGKFWHGNSSDDGVTWDINNATDTSSDKVGLACGRYSFFGSADIIWMYGNQYIGRREYTRAIASTNNGTTWSTQNRYLFNFSTTGRSAKEPSCDIDSTGTLHCMNQQMNAGADSLYYNFCSPVSSACPNLVFLGGGDSATVRVDGNDTVWFVGHSELDNDPFIGYMINDTHQDSVDITTATDIYEGAGLGFAITSEGKMHMTYPDQLDLWYCNSSIGQWNTSWTCQEVSAVNTYSSDVGVNEQGEIYLLKDTGATQGGDVKGYNSSDNGITWTYNNTITGTPQGYHGSIRGTRSMDANLITDRLEYAWVYNFDLYFNSIAIPYDVTDDAPYNITLIEPFNNTLTNNDTITFSWYVVDEDSTVDCNISFNTVINVSGITSNVSTPNFYYISDFNDGFYNWSVSCWDSAGLVNHSIANYTFEVDRSPPFIVQDLPLNGFNTSDTSVFFNWSIIDARGNATCDLFIDGVENQSGFITFNDTANSTIVPGFSHGHYNWSLNCTDPLDNHNTSPVLNFTVDLFGPFVELNFPLNNTNYSDSSIPLNWTASDITLPLTCDLWFDGSINVTGITVSNNTLFNQEISPVSDGFHIWRVNCTDGLNNSNITAYRSFLVDTTPPHIQLLRPFNNSILNDSLVNFTWRANDTYSTINCDLYINGILNASSLPSINGTLANRSINLTFANYQWNMTCVDSLGNQNTSHIYNFSIEVDAPPIVGPPVPLPPLVDIIGLLVGVCPGTFAGQALLFIIVFLICCFLYASFFVPAPGVGILSSITLFIVSWTIIGCSVVVGIVTLSIALILIIRFAIMKV